MLQLGYVSSGTRLSVLEKRNAYHNKLKEKIIFKFGVYVLFYCLFVCTVEI